MKTFFSKRGLGLIGTTLAKLLYSPGRGGGGVALPYISHMGMCRPKEYGFWAFLVLKRVYILIRNRVWFSRELREFQFQMNKKERVICQF